jgi:PHD/YefM family antitoxin component YafN of YafNO toxin-antitoxin module
VLYGAAEFSRDTDLAILASEANAERLRKALGALEAEVRKTKNVRNDFKTRLTGSP